MGSRDLAGGELVVITYVRRRIAAAVLTLDREANTKLFDVEP